KGWPLVRPRTFHDDGPAGCDTITDEYLWGRDVLVAPILHQGAVSRPIVFPRGRWIDMRYPRVSYTGTINSYDAPLYVLPLFVRAGSFIPQADYKMENTGDYNPGRLTVTYYPGEGKSSYTLYDDNRMSPRSLSEKQYRLITFDADNAGGLISIAITSTGTYDGAPDRVDLDFRVAGLGAEPKSVSIGGKALKHAYDAATGLLSFKVKFTPNSKTEISINLK
ncbi:MAG: DUF5110 domain-containing protein, partial [Muribaculaceae bacterium]|nr:DUF5110 domain-containing protein [Muribaculaceae bacterium]